MITLFDDQAAHLVVQVVYGTSPKTDQLRGGEFLIARQDFQAWQLAGLSYPTKFSFHQVVKLPWNSEWFTVPPKQSTARAMPRTRGVASDADGESTCDI